jgi:hypothetical protein
MMLVTELLLSDLAARSPKVLLSALVIESDPQRLAEPPVGAASVVSSGVEPDSL